MSENTNVGPATFANAVNNNNTTAAIEKKEEEGKLKEAKAKMAYESALKAEQIRLDREIQKSNEPGFIDSAVSGVKTAVKWMVPVGMVVAAITAGTIVAVKSSK